MEKIANITVLMPVYNGIRFLKEAVDSILLQSYTNFIFLIIDDGSTDGSQYYLDQINDVRVRVVHQRNGGCGAARNIGLSMCSTEFVAMMDADDIALPSRLQSQLDFMRHDKKIGMVGTQVTFVGAGGRIGFSPPMPCEHHDIYSDLIRGRLAMRHPTVMCRTRHLKEIGGYRMDRDGEDFGMFLRIGEVSRLANLNESLLLYRIHLDNVTVNTMGLIRSHVRHECHCAQRRIAGLPELPFNDFIAERSLWQGLSDKMSSYALTQYWRAITDILSDDQLKGYTRLVWSVLCSPQVTWQRLCREGRKCVQLAQSSKRQRIRDPDVVSLSK